MPERGRPRPVTASNLTAAVQLMPQEPLEPTVTSATPAVAV